MDRGLDGLDRILEWLAPALGGAGLLLFLVGPRGTIDLHLGDGGALLLDGLLCLAFFLQHSVMVRRSFKARLARHLAPRRVGAVFSVASGLALAVVMLLWQRTGARVADAEGVRGWLAPVGLVVAVAGTWWGFTSLRHFDPFGVRPIRLHRLGRTERPGKLSIRGAYRWMRHPLYFFMLVLIWANLDLTLDRLLFDVLWTVWIVAGTVLEDRDLVAEFGDSYVSYQRRVPMLVPWRGPVPADTGNTAPPAPSRS